MRNIRSKVLLARSIGLVRLRLLAALTTFELRRASGEHTFGGLGYG
jgi:hypothetical protein